MEGYSMQSVRETEGWRNMSNKCMEEEDASELCTKGMEEMRSCLEEYRRK